MKLTSKKLFISVFALLFAIVAVATTSFAWFTISGKARVDNFELDIMLGEGIEVRILAKGEGEGTTSEWKSVITNADFKKAFGLAADAKFDVNLSHLTSLDAKVFHEIVESTEGIYSEGTEAVTGGYFEFTLEFRGNGAYPIHLTGESSVASTANDFTFNFAGGPQTYSVNPANAVRVGFLGDALAPSNIWEPNLGLGSYGYVNTTTLEDDVTINKEFDGAIEFFNDKMNYLNSNDLYVDYIEAPLTEQNVFSDSEYVQGTRAAGVVKGTAETALTTLVAGTTGSTDYTHIGSLTVRIWLEGWDGDCFDAILNRLFNVTLVFEAKEEPEA